MSMICLVFNHREKKTEREQKKEKIQWTEARVETLRKERESEIIEIEQIIARNELLNVLASPN